MERQEDQNEATKWQKIRTQLKKLLFPLVLVPLEVIVFALFAALVKYDESGAPHNPNAARISNGSEVESDRSDVRQDGGAGISLSTNTAKLYPCKCREFTVLAVLKNARSTTKRKMETVPDTEYFRAQLHLD